MIRKSEYIGYIDKFLSHELNDDELKEFNAELIANPGMEEDIKLLADVEQAVHEKDVVSLREKLHNIVANKEQEEINELMLEEVFQDFSFELSEDLSSFNELSQPVTKNDLLGFEQSLPVLHLAQHKIAEKENTHQFYKEQQRKAASSDDELDFTSQENAIFEGVQNALAEKDVLDLRCNLQQIATNLPSHERTTQEIEQYIDDEMEDSVLSEFERELEMNFGLAQDLDLHKDISNACAETDIIDLRKNLEDIQQIEVSTSRKVEEIDQYLNHELNEDALNSFENELTNNPDLAAELNLHMEVDAAIIEKDISSLRDKLVDVRKGIFIEKRKERSFAIKFVKSRFAVSAVAASLILFISVAGLLNRNSVVNDGELYSEYFETYTATGIFRSGSVALDDKVNLALNEFNSKNYDEALMLFDEILSVDKANAVGNFYAGMAYQEKDQFDKAILSYQQVVLLKNNLFVEQAEWYTALCYIQTDNKKKAYEKFKKIVDSNSYYSEKAAAILRKLDFLE